MSTLSRVIYDPDTTAPSTPLSVVATALSSSSVRIAWGASSDTGGSGLAGYRVLRATAAGGPYAQIGSNLSVASLQSDDTTVSANATYHYRVRAFDGAGNESALSATASATTPPVQLPVGITWAANSQSYRSISPGVACHGADQYGGSGRQLSSNNAALLFVDEFGNGITGSFDSVTRIGYGTAKWCANYPAPRHVVPLIGGVISSMLSGSRNFIIDQPYLTFHGHCSPGHLIFRGSQWVTNGSHLCLKHIAVFQDIYTDPAQASSGDCTSLLPSPLPDRLLWQNCAFWFSTDESVDWFRPITNSGLWQCFIGQPITQGNHPEGAHNYGMILANTATPISLHRTVFAHCEERHPLTSAPALSMTNCLVYNWGATGVQIINTAPVVTDTNVEGCLFVTGPNTSGNDVIRIYSTAAPGTRVYLNGNRAIGLPDATQAALLQNSPGLPLSSSRLSTAHPPGHAVTTISDREDFAELVLRYAGPRPASRNVTIQNVVNHVNARISGSGNQGGFVTTPLLVGYPAISNIGPIDPANPGQYWGGEPCPMNLATRNLTQASGYTAIEEWSHRVESLFMPDG